MQRNMDRKPKILYVARDDGGCGFFRCFQPGNFLKRSGLAEVEAVLKHPTHEQLMAADLVIMQESGSVEASNMASFMVKNNIPFMTEFDDFIHHISPNNQAGYIAWNPSTLFLHRAMEMSRKAIGITVSTNQLARELFPYNPNIFVVPNYLNKEQWDQPVIRRTDGKIRIGWCGGNAHADDLRMISKVLDKIVKEYEGKVIFETMGMTEHELAGVFPMQASHDSCPSCGYEGQLHHFPGETLQNYPTVLASRGWDIAVAPVINNAFGNSKSDLKLKEYSAVGLPIVASPVMPYREAVDNGATVSLAATFEEWYDSLKDLIDHSEKRAEIARKNKDWVANYWIQDNIGKIFEVYRQVISQVQPVLGTPEDRLQNKIGV